MFDSKKPLTFAERIEQQPLLKERFSSILGIVENVDESIMTADEAEQRAIEETRQLGNEVLTNWANKRVETYAMPPESDGEKFVRSGKKNSVGTAPSEK